jgi:hypothetical protein
LEYLKREVLNTSFKPGMGSTHPVIPALGKWRQKDQNFKVSLGYITRPGLKNI